MCELIEEYAEKRASEAAAQAAAQAAIKATVEELREFGATDEKIAQRLKVKYELDDAEIETYLSRVQVFLDI